ncbi:MAG TPA: pantoate--beta-alanine ligase [Gammaproteobacteria bacterium]|nr:pantoate--beta-alanine ligase [Gammaproteobacteria bacterium]
MHTVSTVADLRAALRVWRARGERIAFVPTMGNLHDGHIALVRRARELAERTVVSIFVNPLQFGAGEDFARYPRTPEEDTQALNAAQTDLLFMPPVEEMYPPGRATTVVTVPGLSDILCGAFRPSHFTGVATVVAKLFGMVQPDVAVFGEKDFQQLLVIRRMVADLNLPVEIVGAPTVREPDGLAMSSRNRYLTPEERARAPALYRTLREAVRMVQAGRPLKAVEDAGLAALRAAGFRPDYFEVRRVEDLAPPTAGDTPEALIVLAAAWLGNARLIDNLRVADSATA